MTASRITLLVTALLWLPAAAQMMESVDFEEDVLPALQRKCFSCHSAERKRPKAGLRLDDPKLFAAGGRSGALFVAGDPDSSLLMERIDLPRDHDDLMPPPGDGVALTDAEVDAVRAWIASGADFGEWSGPVHDAGTVVVEGDSIFATRPESDADRIPPVARRELSPLREYGEVSKAIDRILEKRLADAGETPHALVDDATFARRAYLGIIGRTPSYAELMAYVNGGAPDETPAQRREALIDHLLESDGYALHWSNFWSDLFRVKDMRRGLKAEYVTDWLLTSLRENKPYDEWVREMVTSRGWQWSTPASSFWHRDQGMPLDHTANMAQVFLGTQLVCAQCHNHPSDVWTQKDYYEFAAYTNSVSAVNAPVAALEEMRQNARKQARNNRRNRNRNPMQGLSPELRRGVQDINRMLRQRAHDTDKPLEFPKDYMYSDAKAGSVVRHRTPFGDEAPVRAGDDPTAVLAQWMTSPRNPRFTMTIANRLWKEVMGRGLFEPVDNITPETRISHPQVLALLEETMIRQRYDLKGFLRVLFTTETFAREAGTLPENPSDDYLFAGPVLRRMSAEQLWDSILTMVAPDPDARVGRRFENLEIRRKNLIALEQIDAAELLSLAESAGSTREAQLALRKRTQELQAALKAAEASGDRGEIRRVQSERQALRQEARALRKDGFDPESWKYPLPEPERGQRAGRRSVGRVELARAIYLGSPAPEDSFLRLFGQSDRELIDNGSEEASVPQVLAMMNSQLLGLLTSRQSTVQRSLDHAQSSTEKLRMLYLTMLGRTPTFAETRLMAQELQSGRAGIEDVIWVLLNSREFLFVR